MVLSKATIYEVTRNTTPLLEHGFRKFNALSNGKKYLLLYVS